MKIEDRNFLSQVHVKVPDRIMALNGPDKNFNNDDIIKKVEDLAAIRTYAIRKFGKEKGMKMKIEELKPYIISEANASNARIAELEDVLKTATGDFRVLIEKEIAIESGRREGVLRAFTLVDELCGKEKAEKHRKAEREQK